MSAPNLGASWQWGQSTTVELTSTTAQKGAQLLNVSLPVPAVCAVYFRAGILAGGAGVMWSVTADFTIGVGRTSLRKTVSWLNQPTLATPIEFVLAAQPLTAVQLDVTVLGNPGPTLQLDIGAELAPITWIPSSDSSLQFGMSLPGEAEGLDDDMYEEIDDHNPELADYLREQQEEQSPFPALEESEEHARRFARQRPRSYPREASEHGQALRRRLRNWNGRNGR